MSYLVPTEFVTLPSEGKFYPTEHPLHGEQTIEIRYMTAKDEDILTSRALLKEGVAIDRLLQNIVVDKNINVNSLLVGDKNALIVAARITGYGSAYETKVTCPSCGTATEYEFELDAGSSTTSLDAVLETYGANLTEHNTFVVQLPLTQVMTECRPDGER